MTEQTRTFVARPIAREVAYKITFDCVVSEWEFFTYARKEFGHGFPRQMDETGRVWEWTRVGVVTDG